MNLENIIFTLADAYGVSGDENSAAQIALRYLKEYTDDCYIKNGNVIGNFGVREPKKPHILIDAHIDQIGFVVTNITEDGFLKIGNIGGIDRRLLLAQQVIILGKQKITGIICSIPPHLSENEDEVPEISDICIDIGMTQEEAEKIVSLGDSVLFSQKCAKLLGDRITGAALDDRCGVASILNTLEMLKNTDLNYTDLNCSFSVLFSTQEEVGERGAKIAAFDINPDIAIAVDVSFALTSDDSELKCGKLGKGCMIGISPSLDKELSKKMIAIAKENNIPYQIEVMSGTTGTNADRFSVNNDGVKSVTLSIPLRYMHTPVEVISLADVCSTSTLIAEYIKGVQ
mgnify:CR=1 FL=1